MLGPLGLPDPDDELAVRVNFEPGHVKATGCGSFERARDVDLAHSSDHIASEKMPELGFKVA